VSALAGLWRFDGNPDANVDCARMLAALEIYGPHDGRQWSEGPVALGRRLFRTLPEDAYDRQPLHSRDERLTLVADVRLDNRDELIAALGLPAAEARETCDAAILLACLERWDEGAPERLMGDFAFALWNAPAQKLLLARDFQGNRPLHYHCGKDFFAFASMAKGLHALAEVPYGIDEQMMAETIVLLPPGGSRTFFKGIYRVEPAHLLRVTREGLSSHCFWHPQRADPTRKSAEYYIEGVRNHLERATKARLRGINGAVATQLSGGLDSGAVTATAARLLAPSGGKVIAFTAVPRQGYAGPERRNRIGDERPLAAATAAMYPNIEHVLVRSTQRSPLEQLDRLFYVRERPVVAAGNEDWLDAINRLARERRLNVMLNAHMGNMTFSYHGLQLLPELLQQGRLFTLWREAAKIVRNGNSRWRGALAITFGPFAPIWLWQWAQQLIAGDDRDVLSYSAIRPERLADLGLAKTGRARHHDFSYRPKHDSFEMRLSRLRRNDYGNFFKGDLAVSGIDNRDPTADRRLVEFCLSIPTEQYLADGMPRALARRVLADRLPQSVLNERRRGYQKADWHESLTAARAEVAAELDRLAEVAPAARLLDIERLQRLVKDWPTSGWERADIEQQYRLALLRGVAAGHFLRKASGANR
jgi:asparagine synthase (glutamine-hydrolysing)